MSIQPDDSSCKCRAQNAAAATLEVTNGYDEMFSLSLMRIQSRSQWAEVVGNRGETFDEQLDEELHIISNWFAWSKHVAVLHIPINSAGLHYSD